MSGGAIERQRHRSAAAKKKAIQEASMDGFFFFLMLVNSEDTVFVTVKRLGFAVLFDGAFDELIVSFCAFCWYKA